MSFGIPVRNGLSIGIGTVATLTSGSNIGGRNRRGEPTLILDFVPTSGVAGITLNLAFTTQEYNVYQTDPTVVSGITNIQVWK